jgi:hypothetical protein
MIIIIIIILILPSSSPSLSWHRHRRIGVSDMLSWPCLVEDDAGVLQVLMVLVEPDATRTTEPSSVIRYDHGGQECGTCPGTPLEGWHSRVRMLGTMAVVMEMMTTRMIMMLLLLLMMMVMLPRASHRALAHFANAIQSVCGFPRAFLGSTVLTASMYVRITCRPRADKHRQRPTVRPRPRRPPTAHTRITAETQALCYRGL